MKRRGKNGFRFYVRYRICDRFENSPFVEKRNALISREDSVVAVFPMKGEETSQRCACLIVVEEGKAGGGGEAEGRDGPHGVVEVKNVGSTAANFAVRKACIQNNKFCNCEHSNSLVSIAMLSIS